MSCCGQFHGTVLAFLWTYEEYQPKFEPVTFRMQVWNVTTTLSCSVDFRR